MQVLVLHLSHSHFDDVTPEGRTLVCSTVGFLSHYVLKPFPAFSSAVENPLLCKLFLHHPCRI